MENMVAMTVWIRLVYSSEKVKDQDVDETDRKNEKVYSKGEVLHVEKKQFVILRGDKVHGLEMVTIDEDLVLRGDMIS